MEYRRAWEATGVSSLRGPGPPHEEAPSQSPFYANVHKPMGVQQALDWAAYTDWAMLPHVCYFSGVPDLFLQLLDADALHETAARMKAFNEEDLVVAVGNWR